jgi:hypothetical protein
MIIRLIIIALAAALFLYYVLVLLDAFSVIRWTKEEGHYSYVPFYYFIKKTLRPQDFKDLKQQAQKKNQKQKK